VIDLNEFDVVSAPAPERPVVPDSGTSARGFNPDEFEVVSAPPTAVVAPAPRIDPNEFEVVSTPTVEPRLRPGLAYQVSDQVNPQGAAPVATPDALSRTVDAVNNSSNNPFDWMRTSGKLAKSFLTDVMAGHVTPSPTRLAPEFPNTAEFWQGKEPSEFAKLPAVSKGVAETGAALPQIGVGTLLTWAGVPAPVAFGGVMGGQSFSDNEGMPMTQRVTEAAKQGAVGAIMPAASEVGSHVGGNALLQLAGKTGAKETTLAAAETLGKVAGSQSMLNGLMVASQAPELLEQAQTDPAAFKESLTKIVAGNLAFELPQLPAHLREVQAARVVDQYVNSPQYRQSVDDVASHLLSPESAQLFARKGIGAPKLPTEVPQNVPWVGRSNKEAAPVVPEGFEVVSTPVPESGSSSAVPKVPESGTETRPQTTTKPAKGFATVGDLIGAKWDELKSLLAQHKVTPETPTEQVASAAQPSEAAAPATMSERFVRELRDNAAQPVEASKEPAPIVEPGGVELEKAGETVPESGTERAPFSMSKSVSEGGLDKSTVEDSVRPVVDRWKSGPKVEVVDSVDELPEGLQRQVKSAGAEGQVEGIFDPETGKVHLVAGNLESVERAHQVLLHESLGHFSLRRSLGDDFHGFVDGVFRGQWKSDAMARVVDDYGLDLRNPEHRAEAAEEVIARLAEDPTLNPTVWQRVVAAVREWARKIGIGGEISENDIRVTLAKARKGLEAEANHQGTKAPRFALKEEPDKGNGDNVSSKALQVSGKPLALRFGRWVNGKLKYSNEVVGVDSFEEAGRRWDQIRDEHGFGSSNSPIVTVVDTKTGKDMAKVSYNGRVWDTDGKEIPRTDDRGYGKKPAIDVDSARFSFRDLEKDGEGDRPAWLPKDKGDEVWRTARDLVKAGEKPQQAIRVAHERLQSMALKGYDPKEGIRFVNSMRETLEGMGKDSDVSSSSTSNEVEKMDKPAPTEKETAPEPVDQTNAHEALSPTEGPKWQQLADELGARREELTQAIRKHGNSKVGQPKRDAFKDKNLAAAKYREAQRRLRTNPDYIGDLLKQASELGREIKAAREAKDSGKADGLQRQFEEVDHELQQTPPNMRDAIWEQLKRDGTVPGKEALPETPRSLSTLVDWLKSQKVDSPDVSLRDRFALVAKGAEKLAQAKDSASMAWAKTQTAWKTFLESYRHPPIDSEFRKVVKDWQFADQFTGLETKRWIDEIQKQVPNPARRGAISVYLEAGGDASLLDYWAHSVPERWRPFFEQARNLTDSEKALAQRVKQDFDQKLLDATMAGMVDKGRDNYGVPQLWKEPPKGAAPGADGLNEAGKKSGANWRAQLDPRDPFFSLQRTHDTYFDGIMAGGVPHTLDVGKLVGVYNEAFHKNLSSRATIWALKDAKAADGSPVVKISGSARIVPQGEGRAYLVDSRARSTSDATADGRPYVSIDHWALKNWKFVANTMEGAIDPMTGKPFPPGKVLVNGEFLVHPDHYGFLKNELMNSPLREGKVGKVVNATLKTSAFLKASKFAFGTFHLATVGEHMATHLVNPFLNGFEVDLRKPEQARLVRNGLELGMGRERTLFEEGLASHGGASSMIPGVGNMLAKLSDFLFKTYIPAIKMKSGLKVLERNEARYKGKLSPDQIAELTAHQMNAAGGLQNYRLLGRDKMLMDLSRLSLTAPDFLESRAKVVAQALKPYGAEQRRFLLTQAVLMYAGCRVANMLLSDDNDPHFEWKNAFSVIHNGRAYSIRTIVGDFHHMVSDPMSFAQGRLSPIVRGSIEAATGRDMRTGARKDTWIQTPVARQAEILVSELAKWLLPVGTEGMLPGKEAREQTTMGTLAQAALGVGSRKYTAQTQMYELADKFNRHQPDAKTQNYTKERDARVGTESAYRKLNDLLEAGNIDGARKEYQALMKDGHTKEAIQRHYQSSETRTFTGNADRESRFVNSMTEAQRKLYGKAKAERKQLKAAFDRVPK
jgi:hypothetical protein